MKKVNQLLMFSCVILLTSCASVKVEDSWKSDDFSSLTDEKIVVVSKAKKEEVSKMYETAIANRLRAKGIDAIERHVKYPSLTDNDGQTQEEIDQLVEQFKKDDINGVLVTALKDVKVKKKIIKSDDGMSNLAPKEKSFISFRAYNFDVNSQQKIAAPPARKDAIALRSKTYFLEAVTYNLSLKGDQKLVGILQTDVTDPESADKVLEGFSKLVAKQFKKN